MERHSIDFRENPRRALYILGRIDQEQVYRLTPEILRLRAENDDPITVYIDSPGGMIAHAEDVRSLLFDPNQDARTCRIITVVTNVAASAAADFLALGDYAIAYKNSYIHYHGTSQISQSAMTTEQAELLAEYLKHTNEQFALRLARKASQRFAFTYTNLASQFESVRADTTTQSDLECFAFLLFNNLSYNVSKLPEKAFKLQTEIYWLIQYMSTSKLKPKPTRTEEEIRVLKIILDYELKRNKNQRWALSQQGLRDVERAFNLFIDYFFGDYRRHLQEMIDEFGYILLNDEELDTWSSDGDFDEKATLQKKVEINMQGLWYFVVSLFRLLQQGEFRLTPRDAYWLGIVDEVIGESDLPTLRLIDEGQSQRKA